jgi:hypothetical protein
MRFADAGELMLCDPMATSGGMATTRLRAYHAATFSVEGLTSAQFHHVRLEVS